MSRAKRAIPASGDRSNEALREKPEPPPDLWAQLDALCVKSGMVRTVRQLPDWFTAAEYSRQCGLHASSVSNRMRRLRSEGKIEYMGRGTNNEKFYRIVKK